MPGIDEGLGKCLSFLVILSSILFLPSLLPFFLSFAYSGFFYALSCPFCCYIIFVLSFHYFYKTHNNFPNSFSIWYFSVPAQHHFLFSKLLNTLYIDYGLVYVMLLWRDFQWNCSDFFQKKMVSQGFHNKPVRYSLSQIGWHKHGTPHCRFTVSLYPRLILVLSWFYVSFYIIIISASCSHVLSKSPFLLKLTRVCLCHFWKSLHDSPLLFPSEEPPYLNCTCSTQI